MLLEADLPASARANLTEALNLVRQLGNPVLTAARVWQVDREAYEGLLALAGPEVAAEILDQLSRTSRLLIRLRAALASSDWAEIRAQKHVVMALSGSVGAMLYHGVMSALNRGRASGKRLRCRCAGPRSASRAGLADRLRGAMTSPRATAGRKRARGAGGL